MEDTAMKDTNAFESEAVDVSHKNFFSATIVESMEHHFLIELAVADQLEKQQNKRFYNYSQLWIPLKLQITFSVRKHQQDLPSKPANYCCFKSHPLKKQLRKNMEDYMREH